MTIQQCKKCKQKLSLILNPFEKFKHQLNWLFQGYCSSRCYRLKDVKNIP